MGKVVVCGIVLIYTGIFDLLMFLRSVRLARKDKEALKQLHKEYLKERYEKEKKQDYFLFLLYLLIVKYKYNKKSIKNIE